MTGLSFSMTNNAAELPRSNYGVWMGDTIIEFAEYGNANVSQYGVEGWFIPGLATSLGASRNRTNYESATGSPTTIKGVIPVGDDLRFTPSFMFPTLFGFDIAQGNDLVYTANVAADGQTTVASGASKTGCVVTSATGLAVGDMLEIDLTHGVNASYGSYKALTFISAISGTTVTFAPLLPQVPATGAAVLKMKGWPATADAGFEFTIGGSVLRQFQMRVTSFNTSSRSIIIEHYPQVTVSKPALLNRDDRQNPMALEGMEVIVIPQYATLTNRSGNSFEDIKLGNFWILPWES